MSVRAINGIRPAYSASRAVEAMGAALHEIRHQDGLTWADVGAELGVSEDQAAKYANGMATMSAVTFGRGFRAWNGRFAGPFLRLCEDSRPGSVCDHMTLTHVLSAATELSKALSDGAISKEEVRANRALLEKAKEAIEGQLAKLVEAA